MPQAEKHWAERMGCSSSRQGLEVPELTGARARAVDEWIEDDWIEYGDVE